MQHWHEKQNHESSTKKRRKISRAKHGNKKNRSAHCGPDLLCYKVGAFQKFGFYPVLHIQGWLDLCHRFQAPQQVVQQRRTLACQQMSRCPWSKDGSLESENAWFSGSKICWSAYMLRTCSSFYWLYHALSLWFLFNPISVFSVLLDPNTWNQFNLIWP